MEQNEIERLIILRDQFKWSESVCDPIEYLFKKKILLNLIVEHLLKPLEDHESTKQPTSEAFSASSESMPPSP